jgi:hypothetical protein
VVTIHSRASWGARHRDGDLTLTGLATDVFIHHTVTALLPANATAAQEQAQMRSIEQIGQNRFGTGISYNVIVFPSGRAYQGVSFNRRGTHTGGRNSTARSIAFAGNFETAQPTDAAVRTAGQIVAHGRGRWWTQGAPVRGHRDVSSTACPGRNLHARVGQIASGGATPPPPIQPPTTPQLAVDGMWGPNTTRRAQQVLGTPVDGAVSSQPQVWRAANPGLAGGWEWVANPRGSLLVAAIQRRVGSTPDGMIGPNTIRAMQRHFGTPQDGTVSRNSQLVMAVQRVLNAGRF